MSDLKESVNVWVSQASENGIKVSKDALLLVADLLGFGPQNKSQNGSFFKTTRQITDALKKLGKK